MKHLLLFITALIILNSGRAQDTVLIKTDSVTAVIHSNSLKTSGNIPVKQANYFPSPYKTSWLKDGLITAGAVGGTFIGYELLENKRGLTPDELAAKTKDKLPFFDRGNAGYYSASLDKTSYILFDADYAFPVLMAFLDRNEHSRLGQVLGMYFETVAITGSMYTLAAGLVYRSRPLVYGTIAPLDRRMSRISQRSFYGGHVATTAALTFFTAKVFQDFNPDSKLRPWLWAGAAGLSALMGYMRYESGFHFLSDCVISFAIGAATGILIPQWHKSKLSKKITLVPSAGNQAGLGLAWHL